MFGEIHLSKEDADKLRRFTYVKEIIESMAMQKLNKNNICGCGSSKKYFKCHGKDIDAIISRFLS